MSLWTLPKEMYAEIARFLGLSFPGKGFRLAAGTVQIRDDIGKFTYLNGVLHSFDDQPAATFDNGDQHWFSNGMNHRDGDKPAAIFAKGSCKWYQYGKLHRDNGPAVMHWWGSCYWYQHGVFIRAE